MKQILWLLLVLFSFIACKSSKKARTSKTNTSEVISTKRHTKNNTAENRDNDHTHFSTSDHIVNYARQFEGVRYKWGGTTTSGMDCSGLIFESFKAYDIFLPRISRDMAKNGSEIPLRKLKKGDLLFFKTSKKNRRSAINHVGLVTSVDNGNIEFIHATTRRGVILSSFTDPYWNAAFVEARRVL
ncbi:C40 family peptidase [Changchengzhania lutea]|uniref:C40 family peptidase n=1 Tax=Changchengzhania lutea TaxID=2049305 RepID=UPI00115D09DB|nr:C40 family peptidase [Changchengzhania lutea]